MAEPLILVVDDEQAIADLIEIHLLSEGYRVKKASSGVEALKAVEAEEPDLIILDIMMPGMNGLEVTRALRRDRHLPILMLSAKSEDIDKILGLKTGADDYLTKPFNPLELVARVKAQLRRYLTFKPQTPTQDDRLRVQGLEVDRAGRRVIKDDETISLTPTEYEILLLLASNPGRIFSSEEIFERVWQERYFEANNTVMVHIRRLREKVEDDPSHPTLIKTVWGVGYKLED